MRPDNDALMLLNRLPGVRPAHSSGRRLRRISLLFIAIALACIFLADLALYPTDPWRELGRIGWGFITPYWADSSTLFSALGQTVAFALLALIISVPLGLMLAVFYHWRPVRMLAAAVRSVHEIVIYAALWPQCHHRLAGDFNSLYRCVCQSICRNV